MERRSSRREREVVDGVVEYEAAKVIAIDLDIGPRTVVVYRPNTMMTRKAKTLSDLVRMKSIKMIA
ncbi:LuxR C-terminal-related transcriptional regulator [Qipengyuania sp. MTN3-11]|uniref:LuxR C-terminal-related transcriptional regulator n=1 Tax=Qipengyuania sp. MTN3-11 TaxID=3056557 RepID=UPI0036F19E4B